MPHYHTMYAMYAKYTGVGVVKGERQPYTWNHIYARILTYETLSYVNHIVAKYTIGLHYYNTLKLY